ncbi:two-component system OmpR family sensor histidine kinase TctE protein [Halorhabdus tiamatea SARL4B]|uniref:histidine kinase n=1 Tax=Halorhabdus tiamatea SARL4B TaxID=1033806 RepID=F7PH01_9EURY|nr:histidine kinase N-terminal 7TM domain-containing protein [Halorhabdus tiamatea]ERJ05641.1 two-component system OmpR family sensor histidine kinase TctE protein [Halorhabdus tiamatea SARL4B]CCQ32472.1 PAS/PAC sensor signal transduction histidine kinase [Halorhabdus tiamatea SARL4B]
MAATYLGLVLFAGILGTAVAMYALLHRDTPGSGPLALLLLAAAMWSFTEGLTLAADGRTTTAFWAKLRLSISTIVPLAWLLLTVEYTGRDRHLTSGHLLGLLVEPIAFITLVWTNATHGLVWESTALVFVGGESGVVATRGLAFWAHVSYSYLLVALGAFLLVRLSLRTDRLFRTQSTALLAAITIPLAANAAFLFGFVPGGIDPTGVAFVATGAILTGAILRRQLLDVTAGTREYGRDEILAELEDLVFIVDEADVVVDCNRATVETLGTTTEDVIGQELDTVAPSLAETLPDDDRECHRVMALELDGSVRKFDVQQSLVERPFGEGATRLLSLRDVTDQTRREQQLDVLNRLLRHNLRNEMNVVRGHAELLAETVEDPDADRHFDRIFETVDTVTERSDKVGTLTRAFEGAETQSVDLELTLRDAIETVRTERPAASIKLDLADARGLRIASGASVGLAFEELLTNAIEHNDDDPTVWVTVETGDSDAGVTVRISDDGPGIGDQERTVIEEGRETPLEHSSGIGLWLVAWIVRTIGGTIHFETDGDGTTVVVQLPVAEASPENDVETA